MEITEKLFKVKVSAKGQIVIPKNIRDFYKLQEGDMVLMTPKEEGLLIKKYEVKEGSMRGLLRDLNVDIKECEAILEKAKKMIVKVRA